jgi:hypothetical protein
LSLRSNVAAQPRGHSNSLQRVGQLVRQQAARDIVLAGVDQLVDLAGGSPGGGRRRGSTQSADVSPALQQRLKPLAPLSARLAPPQAATSANCLW